MTDIRRADPVTGIAGLRLEPREIETFGSGLVRPENVLAFRDGTVFASSTAGHVSRIAPSGGVTSICRLPGGEPTTMALEDDGRSLVVNSTADGNVYRIFLDQTHGAPTHELLLDSVDGRPLGSANFVFRDSRDRLWVAVATRRRPPHLEVPITDDGHIVLIDRDGARVVANGLRWPNEVRLDAEERFAYVPETYGRRILRYPVAANGDLGTPEVFGPPMLGPDAAPDGIALDAAGNVWVALVTRNALAALNPAGEMHVVFEDPVEPALARWSSEYASGVVTRDAITACAGRWLQLPTSIGFGGPELRTVYMGSLGMPHLLTFRSPVPGLPLVHQRRDAAPAATETTGGTA